VPRIPARTLRDALVGLVALHSLGVAIAMLGFPAWVARFGGWHDASALFFVRQGGAFHLIFATAYVAELRRFGTVRLLVFAKSLAFVFLGTAWLAGESAWAVPFSAVGDGAMGLAVLWAQSRLAASPSSS